MKKTEDAVSPVIGVMLMLVITIIIAAVVSVFAGGVITSVDTPSQTTFAVNSVIDEIFDKYKDNAQPDMQKLYGVNRSTSNGIRFTITGGDTVFLEDLTIQLSNKNTQMKFTTRTLVNESSYVRDNTSVLTYGGKNIYFSTGGVDYTELNAGDYFILLSDFCYDSTEATDSSITKGKFLVWSPADSKGSFVAQIGKDLEYSIIDTDSGTVIQRGTVRL